ncbi:MAG: hypothetical protein HY879_19255 [Deltaproteobacteria bacterium]|nr:hypothetical protein [Deltaproteobacteria bacterium]
MKKYLAFILLLVIAGSSGCYYHGRGHHDQGYYYNRGSQYGYYDRERGRNLEPQDWDLLPDFYKY